MASSVPVPADSSEEYEFAVEARSHGALVRQRFVRHRLALASLFLLTGIFAAGFLAGQIAPYGYQELDIRALSSGPSWNHPLGTDQIGRDYFSRVLHGVGTEARIALLVALFGTLIGTLLGALSGYLGRALDNVVMRVTDLSLTLPPLITLLVAATYLHIDNLFEISLLLACVLWMPLARILRSTSLSLREREYVDAARAMGASDLRIVLRHVLPNAMSSVAVAATAMTAAAVILETTLSYLGLGINRFYGGRTETVLPSLGDVMAAASNEGLFNWWGIVFPGLAIVLIVMPILFVGDGLRDAFDPTTLRLGVRPRRRRRLIPARLHSALGRLLSLGRRQRTAPLDVLKPVRPVLELATSVRLTTGDLLARRSARRTGRRPRLLLETVAVLALTGVTAAGIYVWQVNPTQSRWEVAGSAIQNVSRARGAQTQVSVALDPSNPDVLFAASNDSLLRSLRVYASSDGGRTWSSSEGPAPADGGCARGDPSVAIAPRGRQYVAFTVNRYCTQLDSYPYLAVAAREGSAGRWLVRRVAPPALQDGFDDRPAIATGADGRVYVAWSRLLTWTRQTTVVSSSADGGRTWSAPRAISPKLKQPQLVSLTVGTDGTLYLTGVDAGLGIWVARTTNHGRFLVRRAARLPGSNAAGCILSSNHPFPAQSNRCLGPNPTVTTTADRVFVTYASAFDDPAQDVHAAVFDLGLRRRLSSGRVGPPESGSDQFWPASSVDSRTGRLWVCFYDTAGDRSRKRAWYSCTASRDGRQWMTTVRAAQESANTHVLWEDARIYGFGDMIGFGGSTALVTHNGVAHPLWIATGGIDDQDVFSARIEARALRP